MRASSFHLSLDKRSLQAIYSGAPLELRVEHQVISTRWLPFTPALARARVVRRVHKCVAHACMHARMRHAYAHVHLRGGVNLAGRPVPIAAETLPDHQS